MTEFPPSTKTVAEARASEPRDDYDSDSWQEDLLLSAAYEHMDWPVTRLFGADADPAAEARREEHRRAVWAELDRESEDRARESRKRQAAAPVTYADRVAYIDRVVQAVRRTFIPFDPAPPRPHLGTIVPRPSLPPRPTSEIPDVSPPPLPPTGRTIPPDALRTPTEPTRKPRRTNTAKLFEHAKKTGATSITMPDGTTINFSQEPSGEVDTPRDASVVASDRIIELCKRGKRGS